ncbi:MAG TPA: glycosyltransferase [Acidimicrobiia bacterium]
MVIPTIGRPSLEAAVASALDQRSVCTEVHVVADAPTATLQSLGLANAGERVHLHVTGGGAGGGGARQLGTERARLPWLAYLDDDDVWLPDKLAIQLAAADSVATGGTPIAPAVPIVSCRIMSRPKDGAPGVVVPRDLYERGDIESYLFRKRRLSASRNTLQTSTLVLPTALARAVGWDRSLTRHQDWDFISRATRVAGVRLVQVGDVLVELGVGSAGSLSAGADWRASLDWAAANAGVWPRPAFADFVAGQPLRYALQCRSWRGVSASMSTLARHRVVPSLGAVALGLSGVLGRPAFERAMHARAGRPVDSPKVQPWSA